VSATSRNVGWLRFLEMSGGQSAALPFSRKDWETSLRRSRLWAVGATRSVVPAGCGQLRCPSAPAVSTARRRWTSLLSTALISIRGRGGEEELRRRVGRRALELSRNNLRSALLDPVEVSWGTERRRTCAGRCRVHCGRGSSDRRGGQPRDRELAASSDKMCSCGEEIRFVADYAVRLFERQATDADRSWIEE
jgi:hypothetical protein